MNLVELKIEGSILSFLKKKICPMRKKQNARNVVTGVLFFALKYGVLEMFSCHAHGQALVA
jgi:hypothetical protein